MNWTVDDLKSYMKRRLSHEQRARETIQREGLPKAKFYETDSDLGALEATRTERNKVQALDRSVKERRQRKGSVEPCCRVLLIACRQRELDDDSNVYSLKPLRDAVAASFGIDDADARIRWEYGQVIVRGEQGVIVRIEAV